MKNPFNIIVLASGNGTNLGAIIEAKKEGRLANVRLLGVVSNRDAGALEKARNFGCPAVHLPSKGKTASEYDSELTSKIHELENSSNAKVDLICLIGYMRILIPNFIGEFRGKIINVHPALLPNYGGRGMYGDKVHEAVLKNGDKETGMTIHYVTEDVDGGKIIMRRKVAVTEGDTVESLRHKVQAQEKIGYVKVLEMLSADRRRSLIFWSLLLFLFGLPYSAFLIMGAFTAVGIIHDKVPVSLEFIIRAAESYALLYVVSFVFAWGLYIKKRYRSALLVIKLPIINLIVFFGALILSSLVPNMFP